MDKLPSTIRPYLEEISHCLWSRNASIMVGAGFSMNAKAIFENAKKFPSWQDLGNVFYKKVRGEDIKGAVYNFFDPLKLAYEVEANFGRPVLDAILRTNIPDGDYRPSLLHNSLLSLPWTDVFTTNYDTLLERAADTVSERNYKIVVNKDDLVHSVSPRIVKLHGCFSASTPLIISEEDYRTYPQKYAPFVNTVQQTLLENTLCLIGFSGDDPNFLKWIGWIRDNLGEKNSPKVYLIGVLNLSTAQEKALSQYNITCVDMSLCEDVGHKDHYLGIKKFIDYCFSNQGSSRSNEWQLSNELSHSKFYHENNADPEGINNEIAEVTNVWSVERKSYPNWLVVPHEKRQELWAATQSWSAIFDKDFRIDPKLLTNFVYEFLWRKEKSLLPIFDNEVEIIKAAICYSENDITYLDVETDKKIFIALALLRYFREEGKKDDWELLFTLVSSKFNGQFYDDLFLNEKALNLLFNNSTVELTQLLAGWNATLSSAYWMYRKASILSEIGNLLDAQEHLEKALVKVRKKINNTPIMTDYSDVSLESYIIVLLASVSRAVEIQSESWSFEKNPYEDRLYELRQYHCNPWQEKKLLELEIEHEPVIKKGSIIRNGFDIGSRYTVHNFSSNDEEVLNAFRFLRFCEDSGLPFSLPRIDFAVSGANNAIKRIAQFAPFWSMCTMMRTRSEKSIDSVFTRESLFRFNSEFVDTLALKYVSLLSSYANKDFVLYEYGMFLPEALSRLCCRCSLETKDKILELVLSIYKKQPGSMRYSGVEKLVKRLIYSFSELQIYQRLIEMTEMSCCLASNKISEINFHYFPNPFRFFMTLKTPKNIAENLKISADVIKQLMDGTASDNKKVRESSSLTLIRLHQLGLLNKNQLKSLLVKLLVHKNNYGLPCNTMFYKFAYVDLFGNRDDIISGLRSFLLDAEPYIQAESNSYGMSGKPDAFTKELVGAREFITWNESELKIHAQKLVNWWMADKNSFYKRESNTDIYNEMRARFSLFVECIELVVVRNQLVEYAQDIRVILEEFKTYGFDYLYFKSSVLDYLKLDKSKFIFELEEALSSYNRKNIIDALKAINLLITNRSSITPDLIKVLSYFIRYTNDSMLSQAFRVTSKILRLLSGAIDLFLERAVLESLSKVSNGFEHLSFEENLELKEAAANLSKQLFDYYTSQDLNIPPIILTWRSICLSEDEFWEVRNQWGDNG